MLSLLQLSRGVRWEKPARRKFKAGAGLADRDLGVACWTLRGGRGRHGEHCGPEGVQPCRRREGGKRKETGQGERGGRPSRGWVESPADRRDQRSEAVGRPSEATSRGYSEPGNEQVTDEHTETRTHESVKGAREHGLSGQ